MTSPASVKIFYHSKNIANIFAIIALLSTGVAYIVVSASLTGRLGILSPSGAVTTGVFLIILALAPASFLFNRVNLKNNFWKSWRTEILEELDIFDLCPGSSATDVSYQGPIAAKEEMIFTKTETMIVQFEDPRIRWNGQNMQSLISSIAGEGEMRFPRPPVTDPPARIDDPNILPSDPEITMVKQSEVMVEVAEGQGLYFATPTAFFDQMQPSLAAGHLRLHRFPHGNF